MHLGVSVFRLSPLVAIFGLCVLPALTKAAVKPFDLLFDVLPNFSDEVLDPKYQVLVQRHKVQPNETESLKGLETLVVQNSEGQRFTCYLPRQQGAVESERQEEGEQVRPSTLLQDLAGKCIQRLEDWWTYEVCFRGKIRQFHKDGDVVAAEFVLGDFAGNETQVNEVLQEDGPVTLAAAFVRESYIGGTSCDVADRVRSTELRYVCSGERKTSVSAVKELHSCAYQITVSTPLICAHPAFKDAEVPVEDIRCYPDVDSQEPTESEEVVSEITGNSTVSSTKIGEEIDSDAQSEDTVVNSVPEHVTTLHLENFDEASLDQIITSLIQMGADEDPDADFLEADSEESEKDERKDTAREEDRDEL